VRFISKYAGYSICYQLDKTNYFGDGNSQLVQPLLDCKFLVVGMHPWEMETAQRHFVHQGLGVYEDRVTQEDPAGRYSVFDSVSFAQAHRLDDAEREKIEQFLLGRFEHGIDFIMVAKPATPAPWPNYDAFQDAAQIAQRVREDGYDLDQVIAYESENAARQQVLDALEALRSTEEADEDLAIFVSA